MTKNDKFIISFANHSLRHKSTLSKDYLNRIFVDSHFVKVDYDNKRENISNLELEDGKHICWKES